jgi:hypothetical protein
MEGPNAIIMQGVDFIYRYILIVNDINSSFKKKPYARVENFNYITFT